MDWYWLVLISLPAVSDGGPGTGRTRLPEHPHSYDAAPSVQGVYDALRGGRRHLAAEGDAAAALEAAFPGTGDRMIEERDFTARAVAWAAGRGTRQFVALGAGMPAAAGRNVHEAARAVQPGAVTVYASADPYTAAWNRALLAEGDPLIAAVEANASAPGRLLGQPRADGDDRLRGACVRGRADGSPLRPAAYRPADAAAGSPARWRREAAWPCRRGQAASRSEADEFDRLFAVRPIWRHSADQTSPGG